MSSLTPVDFDPFADDSPEGGKLTPVDFVPEFTEVDFDPFAEEAQEGELEWSDLGRSVMSGGAQVGAGAGWLAKRAGEASGWEGLESAGAGLEQVSKDAAETWREGISDYGQQVERQQFLKENPDSWTGYELGDAGLDKVKMMLAQSALGTAAGMGAGMVATKGLSVLPGVSRGVAATLGYSSGEAIIAAPAAGVQAEEEVRRMSAEELSGHVEYQALLLSGMSETEAHELVSRAAGNDAAAMTAVSTALLSSPFGKILDDVVGGRAGGTVSGLFKGGATEAAQETLQSGAEQLSVNAALLENADPNRSLMKDVPEAMVGGAVAGAAMGAGMGAAAGYGAGLDQKAEDAAADAKARGGDDLDAELARQEVYTTGEQAVDMPLESEQLPETEAGPGAPIAFNPYQQQMEPLQVGTPMAEDGFADDGMLPYAAPEKPGLELEPMGQPAQEEYPSVDFGQATLDEKVSSIERAMDEYQQGKELDSYNEIFQGYEPEGVAPDADLGPSGPSGREQAQQRSTEELEQVYNEAKKAYIKKQTTGKKADPARMELSQWLVANGSLDIEEAEAQGVDPAILTKLVGGKRLFKAGGKSFEHAAEGANEDGFFQEGEEVGPNGMLDKITRSLGGEEVYTPRGQEDQGARLLAEGQMDEIQQRLDAIQQDYDNELTDPLPATRDQDDNRVKLTYTVDEAEAVGLPESTIDNILDTASTPEEADQLLRKEIDSDKEFRQWLQSPAGDPRTTEENAAAAQGQGNREEVQGQESSSDPVDLFGAAPTSEQALHDAKLEKESKLSGEDVPADIDDGLFAQDFKSRQADVEDSPSPAASDRITAIRSESKARSKRTIDNINDESTPTIFRNGAGTLFYTVTPAANGDKKYQVTVWDKDGPMSDSKHDTPEGIQRHYNSEFKANATEEEFADLTSGSTLPVKAAGKTVATEADANRWNSNNTFLKGAIEGLVGNDPGRVSRIQAAIERGANDGAVIKSAGINSFNKTKVKASGSFPGDVKAKGQSITVTDRRGDDATTVTLGGKDLANRLREIYAPEAEEFSLGVVDASQDTDLLDITLDEDQAKSASRAAKNIEGKSKNELAKILLEIGADPSGLTIEALQQRIATMVAVMDDMRKHDSLSQWDASISSAAKKDLIMQAANILDPKGARNRTSSMFGPNTILLQGRLGKMLGMVSKTGEEAATTEEKRQAGKVKSERKDTETERLRKPIDDYMTPERGPEVAGWWDGASAEDRGAFLDSLGFKNHASRDRWTKRAFLAAEVDGKKKLGLPSEVKNTARFHIVTFWDEFHGDPQAYAAKHRMPDRPPSISDSIENLSQINDAIEGGVLVNELTEAPQLPEPDIDTAAHEAATSPENNLPEPSDAQIEAGNYKKGHITFAGLDITIENPSGSTRSGTSPDGEAWSNTMKSHYGYIKRTEGADGDHVDVFVGGDTEAANVYVIDQHHPEVDATGEHPFDEHKVMLGFPSEEAAEKGYLENYADGWKMWPITELTVDEFKDWVYGKSPSNEPLSDYLPNNPEAQAMLDRNAELFKRQEEAQSESTPAKPEEPDDLFAASNVPVDSLRVADLTEDEFYQRIEDAPTDKFVGSHTIDWGSLGRGQGKRSGGMVMGGMRDSSLQGKKTYTSIVRGLPDYEQVSTEVEGLERYEQQDYAKARAAGFTHDVSMLMAYSKTDMDRTQKYERAKELDSKNQNKAKLKAAKVKRAAEKAEKALADTVLTEEFMDENGNVITVEQDALTALRQVNKRLEVMDKLLGCLG